MNNGEYSIELSVYDNNPSEYAETLKRLTIALVATVTLYKPVRVICAIAA